MKRVLLTILFALSLCIVFSQSALKESEKSPGNLDWMVRIGLNALDQSSASDYVSSKSALGFQAGGDVIWNLGWKLKGGLQYQYHEVFEINENNTIITSSETRDRSFYRLKLTAGTLYDLIQIDYLTIGIGADAAYNFDLSREERIITDFNNTFDLDYFSGLLHIYVNINSIQIDFGFEGNLIDIANTHLNPLQSKTYTLTFGYIF